VGRPRHADGSGLWEALVKITSSWRLGQEREYRAVLESVALRAEKLKLPAMPKIKSVQFFRALSPLSRPIADSTHEISEIAFIVARIQTDTGVTGEGYLLAFHYSPRAISGALRDVGEFARGWEVSETGRFAMEWNRVSEYFGHGGINQ